MKLVDIAYTAKERKEEAAEMMPGGKPKGPEYPYGLQLTLNEETLSKLGIEELPRVGDELRVEAVAKVTSVSMRSDKSDEDERCVNLQITELAREPDGAGQVSGKPGTSSKPKRTVASYYSEGKQ